MAQRFNISEPTPPPRAVREVFDLDAFYQQWVDVGGFPVVASKKVSPYALKEAAWIVWQMIEHRRNVLLRAMVQNKLRLVVIGHTEMLTQIPDHSNMHPNFYWDKRSRGLGSARHDPTVSCSEENMLNYPGDPYAGEHVLIHEFAHALHWIWDTVTPGFDNRLQATYAAAIRKGLWHGTYAGSNHHEYWAEGVQSWFNANWENTHVHNHVNTRAELKEYDPSLARLVTEVLGDRNWRYTSVPDRKNQPHLRGFNPQDSPTFAWPPDLLALHEELRGNPESTGEGRWVNLKRYDPKELPRLHSSRRDGAYTHVFIGSLGVEGGRVYFIEPDGTERFWVDLPQNNMSDPLPTQAGDLWLIKDKNGKDLAVYRAEAKTGRALIIGKGWKPVSPADEEVVVDLPIERFRIPEPTPPPGHVVEAFGLDTSFYKQWIDVGGYPVLASANTSPYAVKEAAYLIHQMIGHRPDILRAMGEDGCRFLIMAWNEMISEIPEYSDMRPVYYWHDIRGRGLGGCHASTSEENLLRYPNTTFPTGSILMHEFAHAVHDSGLSLVDPGFDTRLESLYRAAMEEGLWDGTYAQVNRNEYWAEGTEAWLNPQYPMPPDAPVRVEDTRASLKRYDPRFAKLLAEIYGDGDWRLMPPATRTRQPHLRGFDPQNTPTYQNPPETVALAKEFTKNLESTGDGRWVNLEAYPLSKLQRLQKERREGAPTIIFFGNYGTNDFLYIYWISPDGREHYRGRVRKDMRNYDTNVGALWMVKDEAGKVLGVYRAEAKVSRVLIIRALEGAGPKIEGPWLWMIVSTNEKGGAAAAASGKDYLAAASKGAVTEKQIATNGATPGTKVGKRKWTPGKLAPTGEDNINQVVNATGLGRGNVEYHVAYGSIALNAPRQQKTMMHVGSDDAVKVWLNGALVHNNPVDRGASDYKESFPVTLKNGKNILLVAIYELWGGWSGFFGFKNDAAYRILSTPVVHIGPAQRPAMYWIDGGTLYRLAGETITRIAASATDVAVDIDREKLYWIEERSEQTGAIHQANLDGSNASVLKSLTSAPKGLTLANGKLYLTNSWGKIQRINVDGSQFESNFLTNLGKPMRIAVFASRVYWTDASGRVRSAPLQSPKMIRNIVTGSGTLGGIAVDSSSVYWTEETGESSGRVRSANLDGRGVADAYTLTATVHALTLDPTNNQLYWSNGWGKVQRGAPSREDVVSGLGTPTALAIGGMNTAAESTPTKTATVASKYDVNGDGVVNKTDRDAVALASLTDNPDAKYDVNADGAVDVLDVIAVTDNYTPGAAAAPTLLRNPKFSALEIARLQEQIDLLIATGDRSPAAMKTLIYLQQLIAMARPEKTQLLANYPNPFNPETWIPYELATDTDVRITIYNAQGVVIRRLQLGQQSAGYYTDRERAAYWDGRNALGEQVASGVYFYQLETDEMSALRKMLILK